MNIDLLIIQWEEKHASLLNEYCKGNSNDEIMKMYRRQMQYILDFIAQLKQIKEKINITIERKKKESNLYKSHYIYGGKGQSATDDELVEWEKDALICDAQIQILLFLFPD